MTRRSWLLMIVLAATWGASYLFIKIGLRDFSAPFIVFARTALAALVLLPVAMHRDALGALRGRGAAIGLLAVIQVVVPFLLITVGERWIPSALAGILVASAPIWTAALAFTAYAPAERPGRVATVGLLVGMAGVGLLFGVDLGGDGLALVGGAMVLVAGLLYAMGAIEVKRRMSGVDPAATVAATMGLSALLTMPAALITFPTSAGADAIGATLALGVVGTGLAFLIFYGLIVELGAQRASVVAYLAPGFAVLYGVLALDEAVTVGTFAGLGLILGGSWLAASGRRPGGEGPSDGDEKALAA
ncbi:MAG: DMT family transporter, partial [Solirubrobacterales bacterium]|nr:DMT family transporter [Solirubrobacterales bacterium]